MRSRRCRASGGNAGNPIVGGRGVIPFGGPKVCERRRVGSWRVGIGRSLIRPGLGLCRRVGGIRDRAMSVDEGGKVR